MRRPSGEIATPARMIRSGVAPVMSAPKMDTVPAAGRNAPVTAMQVVVLPAPLAPSKAVIPPIGTCRSMPCTAWIAP